MQVEKFKKRLFIESGIFAAVVAVLGAGVYFLGSVSDDYTNDNNQEKNKVDAIESELNELQKQYDFITHNAELYKEIKKRQAEGTLSISRQLMFEKFNQFRTQFDLNNLRLSVSPIQEMKDPKFRRKTSIVNFSDVSIELEVLYDDNVYKLLDAMQRELSGICAISHLNMTMQKPLDAAVLKAIGEKGTYPLIKADIKFNWYSINPVESSDTNSDQNKK